MFQVDEKPETIHLYVVREDEQQIPKVWLSLIPPVVLLCFLVVVGVSFPYHPPLIRETLKVPAILLPLVRFTASEKVIPTGIQTFLATYAYGTLTITNGSVISQHLPSGMILIGSDGVAVVTTESVDVPAGNGTSYGTAYVTAQAVLAGAKGNIAMLDIQLVYGTSLYIKNYRNFIGGKESYSRAFILPRDTKDALVKARAMLSVHTRDTLLSTPCREELTGSSRLTVTWTCQFVTYQFAGKIVSATLAGRFVIVVVEKVAPVQRFTGK